MKYIAGLAVALAVISSAASAQDYINWSQVNWQADTGFDYSSGRYGAASDTTVLSVPLDLKAQFDRIRLEATIPYLREHGPGIVAGGVVVGSGTTSTTRTGIGDLNLGAAFLLNKDSPAFPAIELQGIVKVPTAGTGLGTGKYDYALQTNLYHWFTPRFMLFGSLGYQWLSSFSTFHLKDGVTATAGANYRASDDTSIGLTGAYHQEYFDGLGDATTLSPYVLWTFSDHWRLSGYGTVGFGNASPRYGFGMRLILFG